MANWKCPKCGNEEFEKDQFQATGGNFAKIFDVQNKKLLQYHVLNADIQSYIDKIHQLE